VTFPYGGHIRWQYGSTAYSQGTLRAVQNRYLQWDGGVGERSFAFSSTLRTSGAATATTTLIDTQANAGKEWDFDTSQDATQGLMTTYKQYTASSGTVLRQVNYAWTQDSAGRNYIGPYAGHRQPRRILASHQADGPNAGPVRKRHPKQALCIRQSFDARKDVHQHVPLRPELHVSLYFQPACIKHRYRWQREHTNARN
jgi:hypothetical protein